MSNSIEDTLRALVRDTVRDIVRDELRAHGLAPGSAAPAASSGSPTYVSTQQAAQIAGVHAATIRDWVHRGLIHGHRAGRLLRIDRAELLAMMHRTGASPTAPVDIDARADEILARRRTPR
jgi:excisionase family DNA binding protein